MRGDYTLDQLTKQQQYLQKLKMAKLEEETNNITNRRRCTRDPYRNIWHTSSATRMNDTAELYDYPSQLSVDNLQNFPQLTRHSKRQDLNFYQNPYEYGARQYGFGDLSRDPYLGPYSLEGSSLSQMGLDAEQYYQRSPAGIRNIDVETGLSRNEMARRPKQSGLSQVELNRFELLPWDPQDHRHIVWEDNLARGGISTRNERLEYI